MGVAGGRGVSLIRGQKMGSTIQFWPEMNFYNQPKQPAERMFWPGLRALFKRERRRAEDVLPESRPSEQREDRSHLGGADLIVRERISSLIVNARDCISRGSNRILGAKEPLVKS